MEIKQLTKVTPEVVQAIDKLIPQLSKYITSPSLDDLEKIIHSGNTILFIAEENGIIVGTLAFVTYRIPSGIKSWIEDVVVDSDYRGRGIGRMLTQHAIDYAKKINLDKIDLTSGPFRVEANELYQRMGFKRRETNVYRIEFL